MTELTNTSPGLDRFWHPVARSDEIGDAPVRIVLLGEPWAVVRGPEGALMAARDRCPHRFAPLTAGSVVGGEWQCGYHGWRFDGTGRCTAIPALGPDAVLPPRARIDVPAGLTEAGGLVWLAPAPPQAPLLDTGHTADPVLRTVALEPVTAAVGAGPMIDNFCDIAHFPFLHRGTFGGDEPAVVDDLVVTEHEWGAACTVEHEFVNREDPGVATGERPLRQRRRMTFAYAAPFSATLRLDHLDTGLVTVLLFGVQPETADRCRVYTVVSRGGVGLTPDADAMAASAAYEQSVLDEDLVLQTRMPTALPLDLTAEVHTRADRFTLALRRVLARCVTPA